MENHRKASESLQKSIYLMRSSNPHHYKNEIQYFTYLLENLGDEYFPYLTEYTFEIQNIEKFKALANTINEKLDKIIKIY